MFNNGLINLIPVCKVSQQRPHPSALDYQALRSFLTEFHDHELVAERMAAVDGGEQREVLYVPLEEAVLRKLLEQIEEQQAAG